jgi:trigger factor
MEPAAQDRADHPHPCELLKIEGSYLMQIVETTNEGLKRAYAITIPADAIEQRIDAEVKAVAPQVKMPGFRPGKVPANLVRKMHGEALHGDALNKAVREAVDSVISGKQLRPAMQPKVDFDQSYEQGKDAELTVEVEVLPEIDAPKVDDLKLDKLIVPVSEDEVKEELERIASGQKRYKDAPKSRKAKDGDQVVIDFVGKIDGEAFEGGAAEGAPLVIGSGTFIPGFEEQLTGVKAGDEKTVKVTFPKDYQADHLAGKDAEFDVTVQAIKVEDEGDLDDDFAKSMGLESLQQLKDLIKGQLEQQNAGLTRTAMKRGLLDKLAGDHDFDVPQGMVEAEFDQIWAQLQQEAQKEDDPEAAIKEIEAEKDDYRHIAERRVRLGLLLSEIGQANGVEVTNQEMQMLVQQAAQQYREDDRQRFVEYIQQEPMAAAQLRAPLYEDKVVDFLFDKADVTEKEVTREELEAAIEADEEAEADKAKKAPKKKAAKKAPAKKAAAKKDGDDKKVPAKKTAAKKAPAKKAADKNDGDKKPAAKKAPAKKAAAKKPAAKKTPAKKK